MTASVGQALNPGTVQHWFEMVGKVFKDHSIKPENIYGADETGMHINDFGKHKVFVPVNMKQVYMQTDAV
jgi:acyl-coenzyme A synthetase/AMP-(fatty) acid ligase